jgi:endonuclease/exonuclease/phosphatase (EEP) superfamily protein YafD
MTFFSAVSRRRVAPDRAKKKGKLAFPLVTACWSYLFFLAILIVVLRTLGDRDLPATLLLFSPRWIYLLPLPALAGPAIWIDRRGLIPLALAALLGLFPLMGFCIGFGRYVQTEAASLPVKVMAFNTHHIRLHDLAVYRFIADQQPDIVALEELPSNYDRKVFPAPTWRLIFFEDLCLASKYPILSSELILGGAAARFRLAVHGRTIEIIVVHLSSPHWALRDLWFQTSVGLREISENIANRRSQARELARLAAGATEPLIIAGDFNTTFDSPLFVGAYPGLPDAFETAGFGLGWTYQNLGTSVRIDHILTNRFFRQAGCVVGRNLGSPHRPIVADLRLLAGT